MSSFLKLYVEHAAFFSLCENDSASAAKPSPSDLSSAAAAAPRVPAFHHHQVDFLYNVNSSREVGVLNSMDPRAKMELQLWASYRAQTLARTVRGMMYYEQAIRLLAVVSETDNGFSRFVQI